MVDEEQTRTHQDEVIFSARYSLFRVWLTVIVAFLFPMYIFSYVAYASLLRGEYIYAFLASLIPFAGLVVMLDSTLFKELLFYQDRVVKVWHLFGHRTIYYRTAKVIAPPGYYRWLNRVIRETREDGRGLLIQVPISSVPIFFPSDANKIINNILDYLTEDTENGSRKFKRARLPKEVIHRQSDTSYLLRH